jgi:hypothetical protein
MPSQWRRRIRPTHRPHATLGLLLGALALAPSAVRAQQPNPGSGLPNPRLFTVLPPGGQAGQTIEVSFTGTDLEDPEALVFSVPGVRAEPIAAPPPAPDPKKPPAPNQPPPKPTVTKFKVTLPPHTPLGIHDVRLVNKWGVSNARAFVVGDLAEALEKEPNNDVDQAQRIDLNTTVNGNLTGPTDVDYFVFAGKAGQRVVVSCLASSIDSRMQPGLELYDKAGRLLAFNRLYDGTDALADCTLPADGDYWVRVCEFTYTRGSPEHFYRLTVSTAPWIDAVFPPVVEPGKPALVTVYGRNLPGGLLDPAAVVDGRVLEKLVVTVNPPAGPAALQRLAYSGCATPPAAALDGFEYRIRNAVGSSNPYLLSFARAPVAIENGANGTPETAQEVPVPCEIAGRIQKKHDADWYAFSAKKGEVWNVELFGERLGAPADLYMVLRNPATKQDLADLDDTSETVHPFKFFTRTVDPPRFRFAVPADGKYQLKVSSRETDVSFGPRHVYAVRITPEHPDFRLFVLPPDDYRPDSCQLRQNGEQYFDVLAWRLDGFSGPITVAAEGLPAGVSCPPVTVAANTKQIPMVLSAAADAPPGVHEIRVKGTATVNGQPVVREARAAQITWPGQQGLNFPLMGRLTRNTVLAVRDQSPFRLAAALDKATLVQGEKANLKLTLARLWPEFKVQLQALAIDLPGGMLTVNNNQPVTIPADKTEATAVLEAKANLPPGTYTVVLRATAQMPYNKDPAAKQKPNVNVVLPTAALTLTVLPKQVATLTVPNPNLTAKVGTQGELVVKLARMHDYAGEFKVQVVVPAEVKGLTADEATVPAGKDEAKVVLHIAPDMTPAAVANLVVRATAMVNGNVPTVHEAKFNLNVVK